MTALFFSDFFTETARQNVSSYYVMVGGLWLVLKKWVVWFSF